MSDVKKMLNNLLDAEGAGILINGNLVVDPASGQSFSEHLADHALLGGGQDAGGALRFRGVLDEGDEAPATGYLAGYIWKVIAAGTYAGQACAVGDLLIAVADADPEAEDINEDHWRVQPGDGDGAIAGPTFAENGHLPVFGANGRTLEDSGLTIETSVPAEAVFHSGIALVTDPEDEPVYNGALRLVLTDYGAPTE